MRMNQKIQCGPGKTDFRDYRIMSKQQYVLKYKQYENLCFKREII